MRNETKEREKRLMEKDRVRKREIREREMSLRKSYGKRERERVDCRDRK